MNQREFVSASIKLIGFTIIFYGLVALLANIQEYVGASYVSQNQLWCSNDIPASVKYELEQDASARQQAQRVVAIFSLYKMPKYLFVILFGLLLCKKDKIFVSFLLGKE